MISASSAYQTDNAALAKQPIILISIAGYSRVFTNYATGVSGQYDWIESIEDVSVSVSGSELDGGADQTQFVFTVQDNGQSVTADMPGFVFEGKQITLKAGYPGMLQTDFVTLFTGYVDHIDVANFGQSYVFNCVDNKELLNEVVYQTGDDGQPTDSSHPHTINAHPLDILLDILENQVGISPTLIDVAGIQNYRDNVFGGLNFTFILTSAPTAKDFIEQELLKPLGGYLWTNNLGQFRVVFFYKLSNVPVQTLTAADTVEIPDATQADLINVVTVRFDKGGASVSASTASTDNSDKFMAEDTEQYGPSVTKYGQFGQQIIESQGMRSSFQGYSQAKLISRWIFLRYGLKTQQITDMHFLWSACLLEPGDIVGITNAYLPDRTAGTVGVTGKLFEVQDRTWSFSDFTVKLTLLDASYLAEAWGGGGGGTPTGPALIAPAGEADYTLASSTDKNKYMFMCNNSDQYSNADPARELG